MALYQVNKSGKKETLVWSWTRKRGISEAKNRIGDLVKDIRKLLKNKSSLRVLEIGCGYGKALLDLKIIFGESIETHGTNFEKRYNLKLVRKFALNQEIFNNEDLPKILPKIHRLDAGKRLKFPSNYFDFIFTQSACQYIVDKALFLEEVNRILTDEGIARIDMQHVNPNYPPEYRVRFEVWEDAKKIDFIDYIKRFKNIKLKTSQERREGYLVMKKAKNLQLNLELIKFVKLHFITKDLVGCNTGYSVKHDER